MNTHESACWLLSSVDLTHSDVYHYSIAVKTMLMISLLRNDILITTACSDEVEMTNAWGIHARTVA